MAQKYALLGGGGLALELMEYMLTEGYDIAGYYAPEDDPDCSEHIRYLGDERDGFSRDYQYIIASGFIKIRKKMIAFLEQNDLPVASFISNDAYLSAFASIGRGAVLAPNSGISGNAKVGDYLFMNGGSAIGHHAIIGNNVSVGPGVKINGYCVVGDNVTFGSNAALVPGTVVEADAEIGILTYPRRSVEQNALILSAPGSRLPKGDE